MTDTRARDALAAALKDAANNWNAYSETDPHEQMADIILAANRSPDQRRALAAAFLDADLSEYVVAALNELGVPDETYPAPVANAVRILQRGLAALRETP